MTDQTPDAPNPIVTRHVVLSLPGMQDIEVRRDIRYLDTSDGPLHFDLYRSPELPAGAACPVVVLVTGYSDLGGRQIFGCDLKDFAAYDDWARLIACRGIAAVTYQSFEPARDAGLLLEYLVGNARELGIDSARVGIWSCSGNVPNALALIAEHSAIHCAVLSYGYTLDIDGHDEVATAARQFGFVTPSVGWPDGGLGAARVLLVRAGRDEMPGLNASLDRFHAAARAAGVPVQLIEHPTGPHAFDLFADDETSRQRIRDVLDFLAAELGGDSTRSTSA